jgi:hypothetical protein
MSPREMLIETAAQIPPARALEDLPADDAERRMPGAPHSIVQIVARPAGAVPRRPGTAGRPGHRARRAGPRAGPVPRAPMLAHYTIGDVLVHLAQHNAHHLGQVVVLRQLLDRWPPAAGSWTW